MPSRPPKAQNGASHAYGMALGCKNLRAPLGPPPIRYMPLGGVLNDLPVDRSRCHGKRSPSRPSLSPREVGASSEAPGFKLFVFRLEGSALNP